MHTSHERTPMQVYADSLTRPQPTTPADPQQAFGNAFLQEQLRASCAGACHPPAPPDALPAWSVSGALLGDDTDAMRVATVKAGIGGDGDQILSGPRAKVAGLEGKLPVAANTSLVAEAASAGFESTLRKDGLTLAYGATAGQVALEHRPSKGVDPLVGQLGVSSGWGLGFRSHWGDADGDGCRELGAGFDLGPFTVDQKSELAPAIAFGGCAL